MYCKDCLRRDKCKTICESLNAFLSKQENRHQGYLADEKLLDVIYHNREKEKSEPVLPKNKTLCGIRLIRLAKTVKKLMGGLSPEERRMIVLRFRLNYSYRDIASEFKLKRRQRAHYRLNKLLAELRSYLKTIYEI